MEQSLQFEIQYFSWYIFYLVFTFECAILPVRLGCIFSGCLLITFAFPLNCISLYCPLTCEKSSKINNFQSGKDLREAVKFIHYCNIWCTPPCGKGKIALKSILNTLSLMHATSLLLLIDRASQACSLLNMLAKVCFHIHLITHLLFFIFQKVTGGQYILGPLVPHSSRGREAMYTRPTCRSPFFKGTGGYAY